MTCSSQAIQRENELKSTLKVVLWVSLVKEIEMVIQMCCKVNIYFARKKNWFKILSRVSMRLVKNDKTAQMNR